MPRALHDRINTTLEVSMFDQLIRTGIRVADDGMSEIYIVKHDKRVSSFANGPRHSGDPEDCRKVQLFGKFVFSEKVRLSGKVRTFFSKLRV